MMSARAVIMGFVSSYPEQLSVTYEHPNFNYNVSYKLALIVYIPFFFWSAFPLVVEFLYLYEYAVWSN